jgi:beta-lactamase class A
MSLKPELEQIAASLPQGRLGIYVKGPGSEITVAADERFPLASVLKVPVLVEYCRQVQEGDLDPAQRLTLTHTAKSPGSGILKELLPGLQPTLHDLVTLMIIRSDNTATDMVMAKVGTAAVNRALDWLGLTSTRVTMDCRTLLYNCVGLATPDSPPGPDLQAEYERRDAAGYQDVNAIGYSDSLQNDVGTPRELGRLLEMLLHGRAFGEAVGEMALSILKRQQINDRLPRLLPNGAVVAHKTGSIWGTRNDVGIFYTPAAPVVVSCLSKGCGDHAEAAADAIARVGLAVWNHFCG